MSAPSTATITTPSFATVTLTLAGDAPLTETSNTLPGAASDVVEPKTMRVPITPETTIRELAKGAMSRFLSSLRRSTSSSDVVARQLCRTGIVATDVHLLSLSSTAVSPTPEWSSTSAAPQLNLGHRGSAARQPQLCKVELFSDDCVLHVVQVREEIIYMRCKAAPARTKERRPVDVNTEAETVPLEDTNAVDPAFAAASSRSKPAVPPSALAANWTAPLAELSITTTLPTDDEVVCGDNEELSKGDISMSVPVLCKETSVSRRPSAVHSTPTFTGASIVERAAMRSTPPTGKRKRSSSPPTSAEASSNTSDDERKSEKEEEEARMNIARSIETLRQAETRRTPWGPDAYKHFATNYVNSPQKIMTGRYIQKRQRQKAAAPPPLPPPAVTLQESTAAAHDREKAGTAVVNAEAIRPLLPPLATQIVQRRLGDDDAQQGHCPHGDRLSGEDSQVSVQLHAGTPSPKVASDMRGASHTRCFPSLSAPVPDSLTRDDAQTQMRTPNGPLRDRLTTPLEAMLNGQASPAAPATVGKPVQSAVARQLWYGEEPGDRLSGPITQPSSPEKEGALAVQVLSVHHTEHCA